MTNERKFLEGELKFVEGKTNVKDIMKSLAKELTKTSWVDYKPSGTDAPWVFDGNREIAITDVIKKDNMKLFKMIAKSTIEPYGATRGTIKCLSGIVSTLDRNIQITLNGINYLVTMEVGDTPQIVASKLSTFIQTIDGFATTEVNADGITVLVQGTKSVTDITTNYELSSATSSDLVLFTSLETGYKNGSIEILGNCMTSGNIQVTINGTALSFSVSNGMKRDEIANLIKNKIVSDTPFVYSYVDSNYTIQVVGEEDVDTLTTNMDSTSITTTGSYVQVDKVGIIEVYSASPIDGLMTIGLTNTSNVFNSVTVVVNKGDSSIDIAQKIYSAVSPYSYTTANESVVTIANLNDIQVSTDVTTPPVCVTSSKVKTAGKFGVVDVVTGTTFSQNITLVINGNNVTIPLLADMTKEAVASRITDYLHADADGKYYYSKAIGGKVYIKGTESIETLSSPSGLSGDKPCFDSKILTSGLYKGIIEVVQQTGSDTNVVVVLNDNNIIVPLLALDTKEEIATKILNAISSATTTDFSDSEIRNDVEIHVEGLVNVEKLSVSSVEIPVENYDVIGNIILGVGDGTNVGDAVSIKVIYEGEEFQRLSFQEVERKNGTIGHIAKLKSRPQGKVTLYKDTIQIATSEVALNKGDDTTYHLGKKPISQSQNATHKLKVYKDSVLVDDSEYVVDYFNGIIVFLKKNTSGTIITCDYGVCSGILGDRVLESKYRVMDEEIVDISPTSELKDLDIVVLVDYSWSMQYPTQIEDIGELSTSIILKTEIDNSLNKTRDYYKTYYIEIRHEKASQENYLTGFEIRFGTKISPTGKTLDEDNSSAWVRTAWFNKSGFARRGLKLYDWTPITYYINFTQEYANIILQGSPVVDTKEREDYLISPIMIGSLENYTKQKENDIQYNFALTGGCDVFKNPSTAKWGERTGTGVTDIVMERTGDGTPYQAHYASFHTSPEFMDKLFLGGSYYTGSQHFSKVVVTHDVQRERGMLQSVLIGDRSAIFHLDELVTGKDEFSQQGVLLNENNSIFNSCGLPNKSEEKKWIMFNINSPYWFANNSPNTFYGIALRKS